MHQVESCAPSTKSVSQKRNGSETGNLRSFSVNRCFYVNSVQLGIARKLSR